MLCASEQQSLRARFSGSTQSHPDQACGGSLQPSGKQNPTLLFFQAGPLQAGRGWGGGFQITNQWALWKCMQMKDANQHRVFLHLQPAQPALGEHFLSSHRKEGSSRSCRKQPLAGVSSEGPAYEPGGQSPPPHSSPLPGPTSSPAREWGSPPPAPASADPVHTQPHPIPLICTLLYAGICVAHVCVQTHCTHSSLHTFTLSCVPTFTSLYLHIHTYPIAHVFTHMHITCTC